MKLSKLKGIHDSRARGIKSLKSSPSCMPGTHVIYGLPLPSHYRRPPKRLEGKENLLPALLVSVGARTDETLDSLGEAEATEEPVIAMSAHLHVGTRAALG